MKSFVRATSATASSSDSTRNETIPPKSRICRAAISWPGCVGQARVEDALDGGWPRGTRRPRCAFSQCCRIRTASVFIPRSTSQQSNGPGHRAERLLQEAQPLGERRVVRRDEAADHVRVAAEVLRRRVDDDVGAELERPLEVGRGEGVVDDDQRAGLVRRLGDGADVDDVQQRVRRRLEPDDARLLVEVVGEVRRSSAGRT